MLNGVGVKVPLVLGKKGDFLIKALGADRLDGRHWELLRGDPDGIFGANELGAAADHEKEYLRLIYRDRKNGGWDGMLLVMARSEYNRAGFARAVEEQEIWRDKAERGWGDALTVWGVGEAQVSEAEGEVETGLAKPISNPVRYGIRLRAGNGKIFNGGEGSGLGGLWVKLQRQLHDLEAEALNTPGL